MPVYRVGKGNGKYEHKEEHDGKLKSSFVNQRFKVSCFSNFRERNITFLLTLYGFCNDSARYLSRNYFYSHAFPNRIVSHFLMS